MLVIVFFLNYFSGILAPFEYPCLLCSFEYDNYMQLVCLHLNKKYLLGTFLQP